MSAARKELEEDWRFVKLELYVELASANGKLGFLKTKDGVERNVELDCNASIVDICWSFLFM